MKKQNDNTRDLIDLRDRLRKEKKYSEADKIRSLLEAKGYTIQDTGKQSIALKTEIRSKNSYLVLFGSGETSSIGRKIHEYVFKRLQKDTIRITIISTPAGFQPNVEKVHEEIAEFFTHHLINYHPEVNIIYANDIHDVNNPEIVELLENTDYIFLGPGSPTYAVRTFKNSLLYYKIIDKVKEGISLCLSSAAVIAFSDRAIPVYEIYKVGTDLYWNEGLNAYKAILKKELTYVPHFNNTEGGEKNDTSCCYLGKDRFNKMIHLLPKNKSTIGIDENTAVIWDLQICEYEVKGVGAIHEINTI